MISKKIKLLEEQLQVDENDANYYGSILKYINPKPSNEEIFSKMDVVPSNAKLKMKNEIIKMLTLSSPIMPPPPPSEEEEEKEKPPARIGWYKGLIDPVTHPLSKLHIQSAAVAAMEDSGDGGGENRIYLELIRKEWEDSFLVEGSCINNKNCIGHKLCNIFDWPKDTPGFALKPFQTPDGNMFYNGACLLCIREKVTREWLTLYSNGQKPSAKIIIPWRNSSDDYIPSDFISMDFDAPFMGIVDKFVYFSFTKYCFVSKGKIAWRASHCFFSDVCGVCVRVRGGN